MAMTLRAVDGDVLSEMNTTPLIDVMLVLLTLLIITLPMQTHAVKITLPQPGPPQPPIPVVMLEVDFDGTAIWNGWRIDRPTLARRLADAARLGSAARGPCDGQQTRSLRRGRRGDGRDPAQRPHQDRPGRYAELLTRGPRHLAQVRDEVVWFIGGDLADVPQPPPHHRAVQQRVEPKRAVRIRMVDGAVTFQHRRAAIAAPDAPSRRSISPDRRPHPPRARCRNRSAR